MIQIHLAELINCNLPQEVRFTIIYIYKCSINKVFIIIKSLLVMRKEAQQTCAYRSFSSDVTAAILVYQNNEMAAILVYGTGISSFLFKYFVLFHHPTGATDHVSENDLYNSNKKLTTLNYFYSVKNICSQTLNILR